MKDTTARWGLRALGLVVILVLGLYLVGTQLPQEHTATLQRVMSAPAPDVWRAMTDIEAFPEWRPEVDRVERLEDRNGLPVWRETGATGTIQLHAVFMEPPERMIVRVEDPEGAFGGRWTYELAQTAGGTLVRITEDGEIYSPMFRVFARFVFGYESTMRSYLDALEARMAGGA